MVNGAYSDDPLEDSLFRDDEMRIQLEVEKELKEQSEIDSHSKLAGWIIMAVLIIGFILWFFFG
ncbi:MAG: hypothetical protein VZR23_11000 [Lachnospiraceae bacterium]|jgi:hypothetical protein|nr:hypothetical protein [Lachnospiraceae bacterium]